MPPMPERQTPQAPEPGQVAPVADGEIGTGPVEGRQQHGRQGGELGLEVAEGGGILLGVPGHLLYGGVDPVVEVQRGPVGKQRETGPGRVDDHAPGHETHVLPDLGAEHAQDVGAGRGPGANSSVTQAPPTRPRRSRTRGRLPALAR
jgi:hypothetical protein